VNGAAGPVRRLDPVDSPVIPLETLRSRRGDQPWPDSLAPRRRSRQVRVGWVEIGGDSPIRVQSMTTTRTADVNATLQQMASLVATGVDVVRVAVPHWEDAEALKQIAEHATVPVVADIHFQWKYAMAALEAGIHGLRINPGNIKYQDKVRLIAREAKARGVPIRIGVNAGSLEKDLLAKHGRPTPAALVESALQEVRILEDEAFTDIKISVKHSNAREMIEAYRLLAEKCEYPLHLGVTEAGPMPAGGVKSAVGIGTLLAEGIGDTIRVSLTDDPVEEVKVGTWILQSLGLRKRGLDLVACPSCGRAEVDVLGLTRQVNEALEREGLKAPIRVAVMGCVVNGPGEAREADLGIAAGKGYGQLIVGGEVRANRIPEDRIVEVLIEEARRLAQDKAAASSD
jgi:(E)-4-hydroxy-3-methylbut-2-enyl-diphosphate synthase